MSEPPKSSPPRESKEGAQPAPEVDRRLLEMLVCPVTRQPLDYRPERQELVSRAARLAYPIRDGIPIMLAEEARELADDEL